jgi:hypothetical protein
VAVLYFIGVWQTVVPSRGQASEEQTQYPDIPQQKALLPFEVSSGQSSYPATPACFFHYKKELDPVGPKWCEIRQTVFGWTTQKFPFGVKTAHALKMREPHVITVVGKAFFDIGHAPKDQSNRRKYLPGYAAWEIHPVMTLEYDSD